MCQSACLLSISSVVLLPSVSLFYIKDDSDDAAGDDGDENDYDDEDINPVLGWRQSACLLSISSVVLLPSVSLFS